jgi:heme oxygenase
MADTTLGHSQVNSNHFAMAMVTVLNTCYALATMKPLQLRALAGIVTMFVFAVPLFSQGVADGKQTTSTEDAIAKAAKEDSKQGLKKVGAIMRRGELKQKLENDEFRLKNDQLENDIAVLEQRPQDVNTAKILRDRTTVRNDRMELRAVGGQPYTSEEKTSKAARMSALITDLQLVNNITMEHNRKYPHYPEATSQDLIDQMIKLRSDIVEVEAEYRAKIRALPKL